MEVNASLSHTNTHTVPYNYNIELAWKQFHLEKKALFKVFVNFARQTSYIY